MEKSNEEIADNLLALSMNCYREKSYLEAFQKGIQAWNILSYPKAMKAISYHVIDTILSLIYYCKLKSITDTIIPLHFITDLNRSDNGEREFVAGRAFYVQESLEIAKQHFQAAKYKGNRAVRTCPEFLALCKGNINLAKEHTLMAVYEEEAKEKKEQEELVFLLKRWEQLPEPKVLQKESYTLLYELISQCIEYDFLTLGSKLSSLLFLADSRDNKGGSREFLLGKLAYQQKQEEVAKQLFWTANYFSKNTYETHPDFLPYKDILEKDTKLELRKEAYEEIIAYSIKQKEKEKPMDVAEDAEEEEIIEDDTLPEELYEQIVSLCKQGDAEEEVEKALELYNRAFDLLPEPKEKWPITNNIYAGMGDLYQKKGEYKEAFQYYLDAYENEGFMAPYILINLGVCYYEFGDLERAKDYFIQTYMLAGEEIFHYLDYKYFAVIQEMVGIE